MIWFTDTSALVKRYVNESGSQWFRQELTRHRIIISEVTAVEVIAALVRRFRKGEISEFALYRARKRFLAHYYDQQYEVFDLDYQVVEKALRAAFDHKLRAYDAVQLSTAMIAASGYGRRKLFFLTADKQLETACLAEGLQVENPQNH